MESKILASNKSAKRDFEILKSFEAGLSLLGPEVKSIRQGTVSIRESYARIVNNEIFLFKVSISLWSGANSVLLGLLYITIYPLLVK